jgi:hypothetical protein
VTRWCDGVAPATAVLRCRGARHRVTWRRGRVVLEDHDLPAEVALAGLGGECCPCLEVLEACRAGFGVDDLFALWTEQADSVGATHALEQWARRVGASARGVGAAAPTADGRAARLAAERRAAVVASLPLAFRRRLALGVFRAIAREPDGRRSGSHPGFSPVFSSLLGRAAAASLPAAAGASGRPVDQRWTLVGPGVPAAVDGRLGPHGGWLRMDVSAGWVADVWAWGLALVDGGLVLEVVDRSDRVTAEVRLVEWSDVGHPRLVVASVASSGDRGWRRRAASAGG